MMRLLNKLQDILDAQRSAHAALMPGRRCALDGSRALA